MTYEQLISKLENMPNNLLKNDATFLNSDGEVITIVNIRQLENEDAADVLWEGHLVMEGDNRRYDSTT